MKTFQEITGDYKAWHDALEAQYFEPDPELPAKRRLRNGRKQADFDSAHSENWRSYVAAAKIAGVDLEPPPKETKV